MQIKKTAIAMIVFLAIATVASVNFADAQVYEPLVRIPGLPAAGPVNLSMYLIGLYNFLLSIVGIVAVMMLIIGGMRYITAAGNQAAISDAKDIITNALAGLLLAILSWVIVAEINPDVLYIKKPGSSFTSEDNVDWGKCGIYDVATAVCSCKYPLPEFTVPLAGPANQEECDRECRLQDLCGIEGMRCFVHQDINGSYFHHPSEDDWLGQDGECICIDGVQIAPAAGADCQTTCEGANCLVADVKMGGYILNAVAHPLTTPSDYEVFERKYCNNNSPEENPITFADNSSVLLCGRFASISGNPILQWEWDMNPIDGIYDAPFMEVAFQGGFITSFWTNVYSYAVLSANPLCKLSANPQTVTCPIKFRITDTVGNTSEDVLYLRIFAS